MFENVDGRTDDGVIGILIAHLGAFGSGELKRDNSSICHNSVRLIKSVKPPEIVRLKMIIILNCSM